MFDHIFDHVFRDVSCHGLALSATWVKQPRSSKRHRQTRSAASHSEDHPNPRRAGAGISMDHMGDECQGDAEQPVSARANQTFCLEFWMILLKSPGNLPEWRVNGVAVSKLMLDCEVWILCGIARSLFSGQFQQFVFGNADDVEQFHTTTSKNQMAVNSTQQITLQVISQSYVWICKPMDQWW